MEYRFIKSTWEEYLEEAKEMGEKGERRWLSVDQMPNEWWAKYNDVATRDLIRHYAYSIGDDNPLWIDPSYAMKTGYGCIIAPPLFLNCIATGWGIWRYRLVGDKWVRNMTMGLAAGSRWTYFQLVREGDSFSVYETFTGAEEKRSRVAGAPPMLLCEADRHYINQRGELVAICRGRVISVAVPVDGKKHDYLDRSVTPNVADVSKRYKYTDEELEAIERAYAAEERRGDLIRYWDDVVEGEELTPVVKGPYIMEDAVAFYGAQGLLDKAFGLRPKFNEAFRRDPDDNVPLGLQSIHLYDIPYPAGGTTNLMGAHVETWFAHLITNWMGDDGFMKVLDNQHKRVMRLRDTFWCKGRVVKKYIDGEEHLVDLDLWNENQEGVKHSLAKATVRLLNRQII